MQCPYCGSADGLDVKETRRPGDGSISRRRRCRNCRESFQTIEQLSEVGMKVRKSDGRVVQFDRGTIRKAIEKSAVRKYDSNRIETLIAAVLGDIFPSRSSGPVDSAVIGDAVMQRLRELDEVTQIRFALVHTGRLDRSDGRQGWYDVNDVRRWLHEQYPSLQDAPVHAHLAAVVKRDGSRVTFSREKLEKSIGVASKGRGDREQVRALAIEVATQVEDALGDQPLVTTGQISAEILSILRARDHIAYLRFASTAKQFESPADYEAEAVGLRFHPGGVSPTQ